MSLSGSSEEFETHGHTDGPGETEWITGQECENRTSKEEVGMQMGVGLAGMRGS